VVLFSDAKIFNGTIIANMPNTAMITRDIFIYKTFRKVTSI
jgi:hypothetical protein